MSLGVRLFEYPTRPIDAWILLLLPLYIYIVEYFLRGYCQI